MNATSGQSVTLDLSEAVRGQWSFVGDGWVQDEAGVITAPGDAVDEHVAFYTKQAFGDFEAEFEFRWDMVWTTAAFIFRARDARHYYVLDFPAVGQQYRAEHFWATLAKVDERGFRQGLAMQLVPGVTSAPRVWHTAKLEATGDQITVWVDHRPAILVRDDTYAAPGYVGLDTYNAIARGGNKSSFRNVRISGSPVAAAAFAAGPAPVPTWCAAYPEANPSQGCGPIVRADNGELVVKAGTNRLMRSADNGCTWDADEPLPESHAIETLVAAADGTLQMYRNTRPGLPSQLLKSVSSDQGRTWSDYRQVGQITLPDTYPYETVHGGPIVKTRDGALVMVKVCTGERDDVRKDGRCRIDFKALGTFALRSDDHGETWSEPADIDGPPHDDDYMLFLKCGCEPSATQLKDGSLLALNRPIWSPSMWESRSSDGGASWTPAARGAFPLYSTLSAMVTTASGAVLIGGRFPALTVQVSHDNGYTWQFHQVDTIAWASGAMIEIEPDVVLFMYGGREEFRCQTLRVTPAGLEPMR